MNTNIVKNAKHLLTIAAGIVLFFSAVNLYLANIVSIHADMPPTVKAGSTVPVTITIEKGNVSGFGRFTCTLPKEFEATSNDQNFEFKNNTVTLLWVVLPSSERFSFTFDVIVPERTNKSFVFSAKFSYVADNEKLSTELAPRKVYVTGSSCPMAETNEQVRERIKYENIRCHRTVDFLNNNAIISISTNKANVQSMCKIEEMLPPGYTFEALETAGSYVTSVQNVARFMWVEAPQSEKFTIAYKVAAQPGYNIKDLYINGAFTIFDYEEDKSFVILDSDSRITESNGAVVNRIENQELPIQNKGQEDGFYSKSTVLSDLKSQNFSKVEADFFANTDAVNTLYQPTSKEISDFGNTLDIPAPTIETAGNNQEGFQQDGQEGFEDDNEQVAQQNSLQYKETTGTTTPTYQVGTQTNGTTTPSYQAGTQTNGASTPSYQVGTKTNGTTTPSYQVGTQTNGVNTPSYQVGYKTNGTTTPSYQAGAQTNGTNTPSYQVVTRTNGTVTPNNQTSMQAKGAVASNQGTGAQTKGATTSTTNPNLINNIYTDQSASKTPTLTRIDSEPSKISQPTTAVAKTQGTTGKTASSTTATKANQVSNLDAKSYAAKPKTSSTAVATTGTSNNNVTLSSKSGDQQSSKTSTGKIVEYKVQVGATHNAISNTQFFYSKRNIKDKVTIERIDNWYKYTIANYNTYLNARNQRNKIWESTPVKGAFVVAYNGKKRITVQEALMLSNQKWVK